MQVVQSNIYTLLHQTMCQLERVIKQELAPYGLNNSEFETMELLYHQGETPIQKIGKEISQASSSMTYLVDKLEGKGHIQRIACKVDRRTIYVGLTPAGVALIEQVIPKYETRLKGILGDCQNQETKQAIQFLEHIQKNIDND